MTIGIAVAGPGAGLAVVKALAAVEKVTRGAIGGFVSIAVITTDRRLLRAETQRGGTSTLFTDGERTDATPPRDIAEAPLAVLMSSGPDRPAPLSQFTPGDADAGLVTGHRLPNVALNGRAPPNIALLTRLRAGEATETAVPAVLAEYAEADTGLIGVDASGRMALGNTALTDARPDLGSVLVTSPLGSVGILHNAIHPARGLAEFAAGVALDCLSPPDRSDFEVLFEAPTPLHLGDKNEARVDAQGRILAIQVTQPNWLGECFEGAALNFHAAIRRGDRLLGHAVSEPYCVARNHEVVSMSGGIRARIAVRSVP